MKAEEVATFVITETFLEAGKSSRGGWNRGQLAAIGIAWPPKPGWKKRAIGTRIEMEKAQAFLRLKGYGVELLP